VANGRKGHNWSGVYVFRGRRPGLIGRIPYPLFPVLVIGALLFCHLKGLPLWLAGFSVLLSPRHTMYVGEGHVRSRYRDHLDGSVKFNALPKPWADLKPSWYFIPLPYVKPILHTAETLLMLALWPVYNHQKNLWNLRRIPLKTAKRQRGQRDLTGWSFNFRPAHAMLWTAGVVLTIANHGWGMY
jgi:hypothetical protein